MVAARKVLTRAESQAQTRQELRNGKAVAGLHVRRSIRQHDRTDIIVFNSDGRDLPSSKAKNIERFFFGEDIKRVSYDKVGDINFPERTNEAYRNRFLEALESDAISNKHFKILVDYSFGLASTIFPQILGKFQATVVSMNNYMDVSRPYSDTSTDEEAAESATVMRSLGYELGFKIDAGAEKIAIVDECGNWFSRQRLLTIMTKLFLESNRSREPYSIAIPVMASSEIDMIAKDYNVQVVRIKNTHSAMMDATQNRDIAFVGGTRGVDEIQAMRTEPGDGDEGVARLDLAAVLHQAGDGEVGGQPDRIRTNLAAVEIPPRLLGGPKLPVGRFAMPAVLGRSGGRTRAAVAAKRKAGDVSLVHVPRGEEVAKLRQLRKAAAHDRQRVAAQLAHASILSRQIGERGDALLAAI